VQVAPWVSFVTQTEELLQKSPALQSVGPLQLVLQPSAFELQAYAPHEVTAPHVVSEPFEQVMAVH
jgi:hypothetical protein